MKLQDPAEEPLARVEALLPLYSHPCASTAHLLCDRHAPASVAYTVVAPDLSSADLSYGALRKESERLAAALSSLGLRPSDRIATLMGKSRAYLVTVMAIWRLGAVHVPLFTAFAPAAITPRVTASGCKLIVCDAAQRQKLVPGEDVPGNPPWKLITTGTADTGALAYGDLLASEEPGFPAATLGGGAPVIQIYTSGTTGKPKGVLVPLRALASFQIYAEYGLGIRADDVFWNAADPGWGYGLYFGIIAAFSTGVRSILLEGGFSAETTFGVLSRYGVTNFAAAPTVYRSLRALGVPRSSALKLRCASSAGEPLTPEVNEWSRTALGVAVHDHYGQTETGMLINNHQHPALHRPIKACSMGHPMPGWTAAVLCEDRDEVAPPGHSGRIAFDLEASPLAWFTGYVDEPAKSAEKFSRDRRWYLTGDTGRVDEEGYFHFVSRDDDVIIMAGYRIGPFEVESVLLTHRAVSEAAAIAAPDAMRGEVLEAFVVLRDGQSATPELARELQQLVKTKFAAHAYPRAVHFLSQLPKTPSGKIQRYMLRLKRRQELEGAKTGNLPDRGGHGAAVEADPLLIEQRGAARWLRLNRPQRRNALTPALVAVLDQALDEAISDQNTAVVVIAGEGASFCAGADLGHLLELAVRGEDPTEFLGAVSRCFTRIERAPKPVVAALHGHAVAGGLELALACDVVVAQAGTLIGDVHARNGLLPAAGASVRLPRKVGEPLARWLMLTGELVPVEALMATGCVHAVAPAQEFDQVVADVVRRLCETQGKVHARIKELLHRGHGLNLEDALNREADVFATHWRESDIAGALRRFANLADKGPDACGGMSTGS